ncbi:MAG TPA: malonyl-CoA synthase [Burkholderiales bacterium]
MNAYTYFARAFALRLPETVIESDRGEHYTYADLERESARLAAYLTGLGLRRGDRVATQIDKSPHALFLYLACLRAGLCYLPLNTAYQPAELRYFLRDAEPRVVVCRPSSHESFLQLARETGEAIVHTLDDDATGSLIDSARGAPDRYDDVALDTDDLAVIIYTSGTTGRSKGAMVTHGNLVSNAQALTDAWHFTSTDVLLHALPIFHIHGLFVALHTVLLSGARMLFQRKFDATAVLRALPDATVLMGVPTFYTRLLDETGLTRKAVAHMRLFVSGSAPLLPATFEAWRERTGHTILERYGMSETGMITSNPYTEERRGGTVGKPLPDVNVRVVNDAGKTVPAGVPGPVQIKGPNVFAGYWRMPDRTREAFTEDGWFRTGDIGQWDTDGYLSIVGRAKDLIISGGYNVYPKEIELALDALPGIVESAVVGIPDADFGEAVTAAVVKEAHCTLDEAAIVASLKAQLANYKVPKHIHFVAELPRNAMGKIQKGALRTRFTAN